MKRIASLVPIVASSFFAQCVMCFRTAAAQNAERARVMNLGIIIMLIPPVLILAGFMLLCYKRRNAYAQTEAEKAEPFAADLSPSPALEMASRTCRGELLQERMVARGNVCRRPRRNRV